MIINVLRVIEVIIHKNNDNEMHELFINLGGLDSVFRLISHRDINIGFHIVKLMIRLKIKYHTSFIEKQIYAEKLMLLLDSALTQEVLNFKLKLIYSNSILGGLVCDYYVAASCFYNGKNY